MKMLREHTFFISATRPTTRCAPGAMWTAGCVALFVMAQHQLAFAGTSGSTMGQGVTSMLDDVIDFMTGPIVVGIATVMFILALVGAYFGGGSDAMKKVLVVVAITAAIIAAPGIIDQIITAAGGVV